MMFARSFDVNVNAVLHSVSTCMKLKTMPGVIFVHEHQHSAESLVLPDMERLFARPGVFYCRADQCEAGAVLSVKNTKDEITELPNQKRPDSLQTHDLSLITLKFFVAAIAISDLISMDMPVSFAETKVETPKFIHLPL